MEKDTLLKQWEDGVSLGSAWWVYADLEKKRRFRELQQDASPGDPAPHMGFRHALEDEVAGRLSSGDLQAFDVEYRGAGEPIAIPKNYFWKGAEIDFENDTVAALGRKFGQVKIQGKREPIADISPEIAAVDLQQILAELKPLRNVSVAPNWPAKPSVAHTPEKTVLPLPSRMASQQFIRKARRGRPSKTDEIEQAIDMLLKNGIDLAAMSRPRAYKAIRKCAEGDLKSNTKIGFSDPVIQRALFRRFRERR